MSFECRTKHYEHDEWNETFEIMHIVEIDFAWDELTKARVFSSAFDIHFSVESS